MSVSTASTRGVTAQADQAAMPRLAVAWQHPENRQIVPVGLLWKDDSAFHFRYVRNALNVPDFGPLLSFPDIRRQYSSTRLFPLFSQRVMDPRRPDYERYVQTLDLALDATPWEQLTRSEGRRAGDAIMVFPEPRVEADGATRCNFLVHGVRHILSRDPGAEDTLRRLAAGDKLRLVLNESNPVNANAIYTASADDAPLGWVPDLLLDYVHLVRTSAPYDLRVRHVNGPDAPVHYRLLASLCGRVPAGFTPFSSGIWEPL
jgi:hypothetical protein